MVTQEEWLSPRRLPLGELDAIPHFSPWRILKRLREWRWLPASYRGVVSFFHRRHAQGYEDRVRHQYMVVLSWGRLSPEKENVAIFFLGLSWNFWDFSILSRTLRTSNFWLLIIVLVFEVTHHINLCPRFKNRSSFLRGFHALLHNFSPEIFSGVGIFAILCRAFWNFWGEKTTCKSPLGYHTVHRSMTETLLRAAELLRLKLLLIFLVATT